MRCSEVVEIVHFLCTKFDERQIRHPSRYQQERVNEGMRKRCENEWMNERMIKRGDDLREINHDIRRV